MGSYEDMMSRWFFGDTYLAPSFQTSNRRVRSRVKPTKTKPMSAKAKARAKARARREFGL